jgi:hypothetical protein
VAEVSDLFHYTFTRNACLNQQRKNNISIQKCILLPYSVCDNVSFQHVQRFFLRSQEHFQDSELEEIVLKPFLP